MHPERVVNVNPTGWMSRDTAVITYPNPDTMNLTDISLIVRFDETFKENALNLRILSITPDSSSYFSEDFHVKLNGLPNTNNKHSEIVIPYRNNVTLDRPGSYTFKITHSGNEIRGINAIGITCRPGSINPVDN